MKLRNKKIKKIKKKRVLGLKEIETETKMELNDIPEPIKWKKREKELKKNKKEGIRLNNKLYKEKYRDYTEERKFKRQLEANEKEARKILNKIVKED